MGEQRNRYALILDLISTAHDRVPFLGRAGLGGTLCSLGHLGVVANGTLALLIGRQGLSGRLRRRRSG
ncbi:hypothetical protein ACW4TU_02815 [Streptomyces sp. QTS52]